MRPLVAIAAFALVASLFYVANRQPDDDGEPAPGEVVPLAGPGAGGFGPPPGFELKAPLPPPPHRASDPAPVDPEDREREDMERLVQTLSGGEQEIQEEEVREAFAQEPDDDWVPEPHPDPEVVARRRRSMRVRRQQSLDLVVLLLGELDVEFQAAREAEDQERVEWLEASARRLQTRRAALERAIAELDSAERGDRTSQPR